jgi:hypothetical protein
MTGVIELNTTTSICKMLALTFAAAAICTPNPSEGRARVALRISDESAHCFVDGSKTKAFPELIKELDFVHTTPSKKLHNNELNEVFSTKNGLFETELDTDDPAELNKIVDKLNTWKAIGYRPFGLIVYDEDYSLHRGEGGPFVEDRRILPLDRINNLKAALKAAGYKHLRLIQLLGADPENKGQSWFELKPEIKQYLKDNFDGIGNENHITDFSDRKRALDAQAEMSKWSFDNNKISLIFIGGTTNSMSDFHQYGEKSMNYLFDKMASVGFNKKYAKAIYFYQAARPTNCNSEILPESNINTVTGFMKWLIEQVH